MDHSEILTNIYDKAIKKIGKSDRSTGLDINISHNIKILASHAESTKGALAVLITLLVHKIFDPKQDIRYHQAQLNSGFPGRSIDTTYVTPFMKSVNFPYMSESGWLTRSFEQPLPYTLDYKGKISPPAVKDAFLQIINVVQENNHPPENILLSLFILLIDNREKLNLKLATPHKLSIATIITYLEKHFTYKYNCSGASRLPTLAVYAAYQCMLNQVARFKDKTLCPLESHNASDTQSGKIGDIVINNKNDGKTFEGVEIKHTIPITRQLVADAFEKFKSHATERYYLLTTADMKSADWNSINMEIEKINNIHGCQVIVNGVYSSLQYYLRLLQDPATFISKYVDLLQKDNTVKYQHKVAWNEIINKEI